MSDAFVPPTPSAVYRCGLQDTQRRTGSLCSKPHCQGCAPFRIRAELTAHRTGQVPVAAPVPPVAAPAPVDRLVSMATVEAGYVSRLEHEVAMARAVREAYETLRANRRDALIAAALQGLLSNTSHSVADVARIAVECADAVISLDTKGER